MHGRLPIGKNEKILAIYKHHWFAYASVWFVGIVVVVALLGGAWTAVTTQGAGSSLDQNKTLIYGGATFLSAIVLLFTAIPVYLRSQEQVVLTEEALLQILQPSIFASKISQLNLQHVADVSVRQNFLGTVFGFGKISVETPGEQDNYEFIMIPNPHVAAKEIIDAHENFQAALQAGRMPSTLGSAPTPQIDPQQYEQFLEFQKMQQTAQTQQQPVEALQQDTQQPAAQPESTQPQGAANQENETQQ